MPRVSLPLCGNTPFSVASLYVGLTALVVVCALLTGCDRKPDATDAPSSPEEIRALFEAAVDCPDRYQCPPLDQLQKRVEGPTDRVLVTVAFDIIGEGKVRSFDRLGKFTSLVIGEWLLERRNTDTLDAETATWSMAQLERVATTCDPSMVGVLQLRALNAELPGALDWVAQDILEPGASLEKACAAGRFLSGYLKDYARVESWMASAGDNGLAAAICALHWFDHDFFDVERDELPLLRRAAAQEALDPVVAYPLLAHIEIHQSDPRFRAVAQSLTTHPDAQVRAEAESMSKEPLLE